MSHAERGGATHTRVTPLKMAGLILDTERCGRTCQFDVAADVHMEVSHAMCTTWLLHKSRRTDWRDSKGLDLEKLLVGFISRILIKNAKNRKKIGEKGDQWWWSAPLKVSTVARCGATRRGGDRLVSGSACPHVIDGAIATRECSARWLFGLGRKGEADWWAATTVPVDAVKRPKIHSNKFEFKSTRSNLFQSKQDLPELEKFEIKYSFEGFDERNNFTYRNFRRFEVDFELKIREASRFEFE
jgi:hypothetical protein